MKLLKNSVAGRSAYRGALLGGIMLATCASVFATSAPAFAESTEILPEYSPEDAPQMSPSGAWAGFDILSINGQAAPSQTLNVMSTTAPTHIVLQVRQPAAAEGKVVEQRFAGTFELTVTPTSVNASTTLVLHTPDGAYHAPSVPDKETFLSDLWFQGYTTGNWNITADFDGMANHQLGTGVSLNTSDIDQCGDPIGDHVRMNADTKEPFVNYVMQRQIPGYGQSVGPASVTFDSVTGDYLVSPHCADVNMNEWFTTSRPVASLDVDLDHDTSGGWVYWGMRVPLVNATASIDLEKTTNGQTVTAAPGPTVLVGNPVEWGYIVKNTGDTSLKNVVVTDDKVEAADINCGEGTNIISTLKPGQEATCTAKGSATAEGQYTNVATVTGTPVNDKGEEFTSLSPVTDTASSWYFGKTPVATETPSVTPTTAPATYPATDTTTAPTGTQTSPLATTGGDVASTFGPAALLIALGASVLLFARKRKVSETD